VASCCECGDEPSGSCATELVISLSFDDIWSELLDKRCYINYE
jgi:hypothetical protein